MSLRFVQDKDQTGKAEPQLISNLTCYQWIHLQVFGAGTIRIANNPQDLKQGATGGQVQGLQLKQQDGIKSFKWRGQLWMVASAPTYIEIVIV